MTNPIITIQASDYLATIESELARDPRLQSRHTRRGYLADLAHFEGWRAGHPMTRLLVEQYAAELQAEGKTSTTINRRLAAVRWWARHVAELALENFDLDREHRDELATQAGRVAGVSDVKGQRKQKGRHISPGELKALMSVCMVDPSPAGVRDGAMIALAWTTGMRQGELTSLEVKDFTPNSEGNGDLLVRHGKGNQQRAAYIYNGAYTALVDWLTIRGDAPGVLFCAIRKGGKVQSGESMSGEAMRLILDKRIQQAGITNPLTWHDFRRTFAGNLLDESTDLATVQRLMGYSSPITTSNYDRRGEEVKRKAVRTLFVPYERRTL